MLKKLMCFFIPLKEVDVSMFYRVWVGCQCFPQFRCGCEWCSSALRCVLVVSGDFRGGHMWFVD